MGEVLSSSMVIVIVLLLVLAAIGFVYPRLANAMSGKKGGSDESDDVGAVSAINAAGSTKSAVSETYAERVRAREAQGEELIAVLAAAVAAASGDEGAPFRIVSYRRSAQTSPAWNIRGRHEYISGKL